MLGWVPPDDRLWRHPSESAQRSVRIGPERAAHPTVPGRWLLGGAALCLLTVVVATGVTMTTTLSPEQYPPTRLTSVPTTEPGTVALLVDRRHLAGLESNVRRSTVLLVVSGSGGTVIGTGVVAWAGGIIVTPSAVVEGARTVTAVESDGTHEPASLVGTDPTSGIAVLHIDDDLPVASFSDDDPLVGTTLMAISEWPRAGGTGAPDTHLYAGAVVSAGQRGSGLLSEFATTRVATPLTLRDLGCPLVDQSGRVSGILFELSGPTTNRTSVFLPGELVRDVTGQLMTSGAVVHGWLGVALIPSAFVTAPPHATLDSTTTSTTTSTLAVAPAGAVVGEVWPGSPADDAGLRVGDVVIAVGGHAVRSDADLRTRLYADPPGAVLQLTLDRDGTTQATTAVLGTAGTDVPGGTSSS
jgi:S1-C subfamily serine protease